MANFRSKIAAAWQWLRIRITTTPAPPPLSTETHTCDNCGHTFEGNFCPRCGQIDKSVNIGFRFAVARFLDVWGMGDDRLLRTIVQLLYRPGYLIGEYLRGHRIGVFSPVNMLFICATVSGALHYFLDEPDAAASILDGDEDATTVAVIESFEAIGRWCDDHTAFAFLIFHTIFAIFSFLLFRRSPHLERTTFGEHVVVQMFIICQMLVLSSIYLIFDQSDGNNIYDLPLLLTVAVLYIDYKQLFGRGWWSTLWRLLMAMLANLVIFIAAAFVWLVYSTYEIAQTGAPQ